MPIFAANKKIFQQKSLHNEKICISHSHHADHPRRLGTEEQGAQTHQKEHHVCRGRKSAQTQAGIHDDVIR